MTKATGKETEAQRRLREEQEALDKENMGTGGKAHNGEPVSLDERRQGRAADAQLATDGSEEPIDEEHDGQLAWEVEPGGKRMTLGSLIPRNVPVEYKVKVAGKSISLKGGLNDPTVEQLTVSSLVISKFEIAYIRDEQGQITKVIVYEHKVPKTINPAKSEAAQLMLHGQSAAAS